MTPKIVGDYILVASHKEYKDTITLQSGVELYLDTAFDPDKHKTCSAEVVAIPEKLSQDQFWRKELGLPNYTDVAHIRRNRLPNPNDVTEKVMADCVDVFDLLSQPGTYTLYFNYLGIQDDHEVRELGVDEKGRKLYRIPVSMCIAYSYQVPVYEIDVWGDSKIQQWKDKLVPMCGNILCEELLEDKSNLEVRGADGSLLLIKHHSYEAHGKPIPTRLRVREVCRPLRGDDRIGVKVGDKIWADTTLTYTETILGKEYHILRYKDVLAVE